MLKSILLVGAGSCIGGIVRYLLLLAIKSPGNGFPLGVLLVNLIGCLLIGIIYGVISRIPGDNSDVLLLLTTGVCGGFTTFSTFANDSIRLLQEHNWTSFGLYIGASVILGLLCVMAGYAIVHAISSTSAPI